MSAKRGENGVVHAEFRFSKSLQKMRANIATQSLGVETDFH